MSRFAALALCVAFSCCALFFAAPVAWTGDPPEAADPFDEADDDVAATGATTVGAPNNGNLTARWEAKIREALDDPTKVEVIETPLQDVVTYLKELHAIQIQLDKTAMADAGADPEGIVTLSVNGISLKSALGLLLGPMDLTYIIRDEVLMITTKVAAEKTVELRVYNAGELVGSSANVRELAEMLRSMFKDNFDVVPFCNLLVVQTSQHRHEELSGLLDQMKSRITVEPLSTKP
jgi:hypothetical protein